MPTVRLELLGLYETADVSWYAQTFLRRPDVRHMISGINIPDKGCGSLCLEWAQALLAECPGLDICVHYSLACRSQVATTGADRENVHVQVQDFIKFCEQAREIGVARVLLVSGPGGWQRPDTVELLEECVSILRNPRLDSHHDLAPKRCKREHSSLLSLCESFDSDKNMLGVQLGVAFNPSLTSAKDRARERDRIERKLKTCLVQEVWLNTSVDTTFLREGIAFLRHIEAIQHLKTQQKLTIYASALRPNEGQRWQFWWGRNGVDFGEKFLDSMSGMEDCIVNAFAVFRELGVEPLIESKMICNDHFQQLEALLGKVPSRTPQLR